MMLINTKEILRIIGCFDRLIKVFLFVESLHYINAEDRSVHGEHLLVVALEVC